MTARRNQADVPGFYSYTIEHRYTGNVELLLPTSLVEALRLDQQLRAEAAEAERQEKEEKRLLGPQPAVGSGSAPSSPAPPDRDAFVAAFERGLHSRAKRRSHPVLRGDELYRVMARVSTLRDRDYQKRELDLVKKLEKAGALREVINPAFHVARWQRALSSLRATHPHFATVTDFVAGRVALSARSREPLKLPPMHLWGSPGLGKTLYANDLATALGSPLRRHSMENAQTTSLLLGGERHWSTASHGLVFDQVCLGAVANLRENIEIGRVQPDDQALLAAMRTACLDEIVAQLPQGVATAVGERGERLSGGQRQLVAIARALLAQPRLLLLDEPSSMVDPATEQKLIERLRSLQGTTQIVVTHRMAMLALVDRLVMLDRGRVVADGPRDAVLQALAQRPAGKAAKAGTAEGAELAAAA